MSSPLPKRRTGERPTPSSAIWRRPLSVAMDSTFEFMGILALDGTLVDANRTALAFVGAALPDVVGRPFWDTPWWSTSESRDWLPGAVAQAAAGSLVRGEVDHVAPDGRRIVVDFSITPLRDESGNVCGLLAEGRDVTDRKRLEEERRRLLSEALDARGAAEAAAWRAAFLSQTGETLAASLDIETTFERLTAAIVPAVATFCIIDVVDQSGAVRRLQVTDARPEMSDAAQRLSAYPRDRQRRYLTSEAIAGGGARLVAEVDDAFLADVAHDDQHLAVLRTLAPASFMVAPLVARGRTLGAIAFCRAAAAPRYDELDLTMVADLAHRAALAVDNARLYDESRRATRSRDDMLGLVSHDLRNPLSAISMCVSALLDRVDGAGRSAELLRTIRDSADWAHRLIEDLLDASAIEAGRLSLARQSVDLTLVGAQAAELFGPQAEERGIVLAVELPPSLPPVHADPDRILQALANLLGNALKFTPSGGRVTIGGASDGASVTLSVTDTGPGVPPADVPFVFDRYWHARRSAQVPGTGLGLAIVKGIAEAHAGRAWFEAGEGGGSRFSIAVPVLAPTA